ncbi:uncharacterized protein LOC62_03G004639 [Vanrija pseudolonga]|uniref:Uncharacterized protein n=1 Tax=Vanrija pseudolonga TaxID=143232 RepID=A0AAF0YAC5_9TREE|nr:hypothetical protein LOC62_03G004639 [Vanrija pseudolonga]
MARSLPNGTSDASHAPDATVDSDLELTPGAEATSPSPDPEADDPGARTHADTLAQAYIPTIVPSFAYAPPPENLAVPAWVGASEHNALPRRRRVPPEQDPRRVRTPADPRERSPARHSPAPFLRVRTPETPAPRAVPNGAVNGERRVLVPPRLPPPMPLLAPVPQPNRPIRAAFLPRGGRGRAHNAPRSHNPNAIPVTHRGPLTFAALDARLHAPRGNTYLRIHGAAAASQLVWTGERASSGFSAVSPAYAGLSPSAYAAARTALAYGAPGWVPGPYLADMAARHVLAEAPEDGTSAWISATSSLNWAVWAVAQALVGGENEVRMAVIVPTGEVFLPASRITLPLAAANRAKDAGEVLFFARVFGGSVTADLVWTSEALPFALPARFWKTRAQRPLVGSWLDNLRFDPREPFERAVAHMGAGGEVWPDQPVHSLGHAWPPTSSDSGDADKDTAEVPVEEMTLLSLSPAPVVRGLQAPLEPERCFLLW